MSLPLDTVEFLNENANRAFPFKSTGSRTSTNGLLTLPNDFIVDMLCAVDSNITNTYYISAVVSSSAAVSVTLNNTTGIVGTFQVSTLADENQVVFLVASSGYVGANGKIVIGSTTTLLSLAQGEFAFTSEATELESRCFVPMATGVARITMQDSDGNSTSYTGTVIIKTGFNLRYEQIDGQTVTLHAGEGLGLNTTCTTIQPILTINGISPDVDGNFNFDTAGCATLTGITNGLLLTNDCTKPCIGCTEIAELLNRVMSVENNLLNLRNTYQTLLSEYQALQQALTCSC